MKQSNEGDFFKNELTRVLLILNPQSICSRLYDQCLKEICGIDTGQEHRTGCTRTRTVRSVYGTRLRYTCSRSGMQADRKTDR